MRHAATNNPLLAKTSLRKRSPNCSYEEGWRRARVLKTRIVTEMPRIDLCLNEEYVQRLS